MLNQRGTSTFLTVNISEICPARVRQGRLFIYHNYRKAMSDDSVDGSIDSYGPVVVAGDLGAAQGRRSDRLGPYETAFSASITVPPRRPVS